MGKGFVRNFKLSAPVLAFVLIGLAAWQADREGFTRPPPDGPLRIGEVQGDGEASPYAEEYVSLSGVVTADFQQEHELRGFFLQDMDPDGNASTSDGIFVFEGATDVRRGDLVELSGRVVEYQTQTELMDVETLTVVGEAAVPEPVPVTLPLADEAEWERYEGMLVRVSGEAGHLTVVDSHDLGRGGVIALATGRLFQFTELHEPEPEGFREYQEALAGHVIRLDDGKRQQNPAFIPYSSTGSQLSARTPLRSGDETESVTGVVGYGDAGWDGTEAFRLHPVEPVEFRPANPRPQAPPEVGGRLRVGGFNVLNLFNGNGRGERLEEGRGADDVRELDRQLDKLVSAIVELDADVLGLMEIENDPAGETSSLALLVRALNEEAGEGTFAAVETGRVGSDEIAVGIIYRPRSVVPTGMHRVLGSSLEDAVHDVDPDYRDDLNRPALAQLFEERSSGERFTLIVAHLKSKGGSCRHVGDFARFDGQGECNGVRTDAARAIGSWSGRLAQENGDPDVLLLGDLNAYSREEPLRALERAGFIPLLPEGSYTYVNFGLSGLLDHALATPELSRQVSGAGVWHINADEAAVLDYNVEFKSDRQLDTLFAPDPFRSSDHDPVLVGLELGSGDGKGER